MSNDPAVLARRFPPDFLFGTATAAYQIEGAHDADGKGPSIWDAFCRTPGAISTGETGDVACDHYHRWRKEVALLRELGCDAYRFSISWPRIVPDGRGAVNERGLAFYETVVDELLANGIRPFVTLYHWDLPQALQERGGWSAMATVSAFARYAEIVARRLGDRVRDWMTLNEPQVVAYLGHHEGVHAPGLRDFGTAVNVSHNLLLAHRAGAHAIRSVQRDARVGIALNLSPCDPATDAPADIDAAARVDGHNNRWFLDPLFGRGYPEDMLELYRAYFDRGRELDGYDGTLDFLGVNYYFRRVVRAGGGPLRAEIVEPERGERTAMGWEVDAASFRKLLVQVHRDYAPPHLYVTESGAAYDDAVVGGRIADPARVAYLADHFAAAASAIADGVPLRGYFVWTLMDNFEWAYGTSKRFGLVHVDFSTQRRRIKASGEWFRALTVAHHDTRRTAPVRG